MAKSGYTEKLADEICEAISFSSKGLEALCAEHENWPHPSQIYRWMNEHESFREKYARAREAQADYLADEIIQIADDGLNDTQTDEEGNERIDHDHIARSRLRVDARKWKASKLAPKKYGDKVDLTHAAPGGGPVETELTIKFVRPSSTEG